MKWLKENWGWLAIIFGLALILLSSQMGINDYKREIGSKSDSIALLKGLYHQLEEREARAQETLRLYDSALTHKDSLYEVSKIEIINLKQRHAKQVADLIRIPSDVLYIDLKHWLDTIQF